ncbi:PIN domain-like protein, partial [Testicularia cyperi]
MGVQGLWQLLQPVARPIKIETLEGKRLAIDSSLWLYHFQMAMRDGQGRTLSNAHILGFLWRILKLLFHGIRPVFVFDGGAPVMKRKTLSGRKARRQGAKESHARTAEKLLAAQMRQAAVRHVAEGQTASTSTDLTDPGLDADTVYFDDLQAGRPKAIAHDRLRDSASAAIGGVEPSSREASSSPSKPRKIDWHKDPYALPAMDKDLNQLAAANGRKGKRKDYRFATEDELRAVMNTIAPEDLDTNSELFRSLPPELQYELVGDLRAQSRMTSYKRLQSMLASAPTPIDFSRAQIAGLKTRNDLTQKVLTVTDEIGNANIKVPIRVAGERNKEYVLVRNPGAEGGFVLGVRDAGRSKDKAIDVDFEPEQIDITDDEAGKTESEPELEMDEVEIPNQRQSPPSEQTADPDVLELRKESDPHKRKEKALELLQARARYHAKQKRKEAGIEDEDELHPRKALRRMGDRPLFIREQAVAKQRSAAGTSSTSTEPSEWIDLESDDEDEVEYVHGQKDQLEEDEAEDLARALAESQQDHTKNADSPVSNRMVGFNLGHRSGEPISLHHAMKQHGPPPTEADISTANRAVVRGAPSPTPSLEMSPVAIEPMKSVERRGPTTASGQSALIDGIETDFDEVALPPLTTPSQPRGPGSPQSLLLKKLTSTQHSMQDDGVKFTPSTLEPTGHVHSPVRESHDSDLVPHEAAGVSMPAGVGDPSQEGDERTSLTVIESLAAEAAGAGTDDEVSEATSASTWQSEAQAQEQNPGRVIRTTVNQKASIPPAPIEITSSSPVPGDVSDDEIEAIELPPTPEEVNEEIRAIDQVRENGAASVAEDTTGEDAGEFVALDNIPAAANEAAAVGLDDDAEEEASRQGTPIEWSPTPSPSPEPVVLGADGFPLPTAEELDALDAEDEAVARLNADQNEFVAFLSATKGRSLLDVQREVEGEVNALRAEFANSRRTEEDITRQMAQEIQMMLRLFGLPYITAPMEAEAQCAELVSRRLVDGIITDDSDVFLFGGTRIYKNMFNNNKIVECFLLSDMERELGLDREKLVRLAYYLGSDYTEGLQGVGPVVAMELLALFPGEQGLQKFRDWWIKVQMGKDNAEDKCGKTMRRIKKNLRNKVHLEPSWPEPEVVKAYYEPSVDPSDEPFAWGLPDLDSLRTFLGEYLHWPVTKTDQYLLPIIERQNARNRARANQSTLDRNGFFDTSAGTGVYAGRKKVAYQSNRLQDVINRFREANRSR